MQGFQWVEKLISRSLIIVVILLDFDYREKLTFIYIGRLHTRFIKIKVNNNKYLKIKKQNLD